MPSWGSAVGKIFDWIPGKREKKQTEIDRLLRENEKLQKEYPLSAASSNRLTRNIDRINVLRSEITRIA